MPQRREIQHTVSKDLYSMHIFEETLNYFNINPAKEFINWAIIDVNDIENIPAGMYSYELSGWFYAFLFIKVRLLKLPKLSI